MFRIRRLLLLFVVPLLALPTPALAQGESPPARPCRAAGEVVAVDLEANAFEFLTRRGVELTVHITEETTFRSPGDEITSFADLETGMKAIVSGAAVPGGIEANLVTAAHEEAVRDLGRFAGEVFRVEANGRRFTLENRGGEQIELIVTDTTRFHSGDESFDGAEDLQRGMFALVLYRQRDGVNVALRVGVRTQSGRPDRPSIDVRLRGEILELSETSLTLAPRRGEPVTFAITEQTVIRSPGSDRPEVGDLAIVLATEAGDGRLVARVVLSRPDQGPRGPWGQGVGPRTASPNRPDIPAPPVR